MGHAHRRTKTTWRTRPYKDGDKGSMDPGRKERKRKKLKAAGMTNVKDTSVRNLPPATPKQLAFLKQLAAELGIPAPLNCATNRKAASGQIELLLAKKEQRVKREARSRGASSPIPHP